MSLITSSLTAYLAGCRPRSAKLAVLRICRENLSPKGIAYVSYNTYPGWKAGDIVRDAMLLHSHSASSDEEKLSSAKAMLTLLSEGLSTGNPLAPSLRGAVAQLQEQSDYYVPDEYLETFNSPCYFLEFADAAEQAGLAYLGDAEAYSEVSATYGQNVQLNHSLIAMGQPKVLRQQYLDFAIGRNFRKSIVIHQERKSEIAVGPELDRCATCVGPDSFRPEATPKVVRPASTTYINHRGGPCSTTEASVSRSPAPCQRRGQPLCRFTLWFSDMQTQAVFEVGAGSIEKAVQEALATLYEAEPAAFQRGRRALRSQAG